MPKKIKKSNKNDEILSSEEKKAYKNFAREIAANHKKKKNKSAEIEKIVGPILKGVRMDEEKQAKQKERKQKKDEKEKLKR